jgi:hypothetical protein
MKRLILIGISIDILIVALTLVYVYLTPDSADIASAEIQYDILATSSVENTSPKIITNKIIKSAPASTNVFHPAIFGVSEYTPDELGYILQKIADCESDGKPSARNQTSTAKGLLQILDGTWKSFRCSGNVLNGDDNMRCGVKIATESGLQHWNASKACWVKHITVGSLVNS